MLGFDVDGEDLNVGEVEVANVALEPELRDDLRMFTLRMLPAQSGNDKRSRAEFTGCNFSTRSKCSVPEAGG